MRGVWTQTHVYVDKGEEAAGARARARAPSCQEESALHISQAHLKNIHSLNAIAHAALPTTPRSFFLSKAFLVIAAKPAYSEHEITVDLSLPFKNM